MDVTEEKAGMVTETAHHVGECHIVCEWVAESIGPVKVTVTPAWNARPGIGVTVTTLRNVSFLSFRPPEILEGDLEVLADWVKAQKRGKRGGGPGSRYHDAFWARIALMYRLATNEGGEAVQVVADLCEVKHRVAEAWVRKARDHGFLSATTRGRNGGQPHGRLTDKARELFAAELAAEQD